MKREERYGCRRCGWYVPPGRAGIGGAPMKTGRCGKVGRTLTRVKQCPKATQARLIAAAPYLLDAAKLALDLSSLSAEVRIALTEAVAKAEGRA